MAIQDKPLPEGRVSTRGGDGAALVVRMKKEQLVGFEAPREGLSQLQRAMLAQLNRGDAGGRGTGAAPDMARFVTGPEAHVNIAELQAQLQAMGGGLTAAALDALGDEESEERGGPLPSRSAPPAGMSLPHGGSGAGGTSTPRLPAASARPRGPRLNPGRSNKEAKPDVVPEQIRASRETDVILRARETSGASDVQDGVHTLIYDLGGQPEFWPLVGEFLRE